ncbi:MAG: pilus assembly protein PilM [Candidatus Wildermuthbacteria bacterium]|nr:pilus assembly protein PilM [Candidatus Wildermuthbacteria bacterium]
MLQKGRLSKERVLLIDVGDVYLKFAFCEKEERGYRVVLWGSEELNVIFWRRPLQTVWEVIERSYGSWGKYSGSNLSKMVISFSPSVFKARVREFVFSRKDSKSAISREEENGFLSRVKEMLQHDVLDELSKSSGIREGEFMLKKIETMKFLIDGYEVPKLCGFEGREVRCFVLGTFLLRLYSTMLESMAREKKLQLPMLIHEAEALRVFSTLKGKNGIFIDMGDSMTQGIGVKNGEVLFVKEHRKGGDVFTHQLEQMLGMNAESAREFKKKYSRGQLSEDLRKRVSQLFLPEARNFGIMIEEWAQVCPSLLSEPFFLLGGGAQIPELKEFLAEKRDTEILAPQDVQNVFSWNCSLDPQYTPLMLQFYGIQ